MGILFPAILPALCQHLVLHPPSLYLVASSKVFCFSQILRSPDCPGWGGGVLSGTLELRFLKEPGVSGSWSIMWAGATQAPDSRKGNNSGWGPLLPFPQRSLCKDSHQSHLSGPLFHPLSSCLRCHFTSLTQSYERLSAQA